MYRILHVRTVLSVGIGEFDRVAIIKGLGFVQTAINFGLNIKSFVHR